MGGGSWSGSSYRDAAKVRLAAGDDDFKYSDDIKSGKIAADVHSLLDPKKVAGPGSPVEGKPIRESRDSTEHPESLPIAVIFDVTGSMGGVPRVLQKKLEKLMDVIIDKAGIKDSQICVGAVGDTHSDRVPFQIGQFESDNRFDEQLRSIYLEGAGGGQDMESYGLAYKWAADHTATDAFEKRGKKGYLFTMGDERFWPELTADEMTRIFGLEAAKEEGVESIFCRAKEKWEIFHFHCNDGSATYRNNPTIFDAWKGLLGERFIPMDDSNLICETIAGVVHMIEGAHDADKVIADIGLSGASARTVKNALALVAVGASLPTHVASGNLPDADHTGGVVRL